MISAVVPNEYRALFISDVHLGSAHCQAQRLFDFLHTHTADVIYLIGDLIDHPMHLKNLPKLHVEILRELISRSFDGSKLIFIPGNHDQMFRHYVGQYGNIKITYRHVHVTKVGARLLITHGDETDMFGLNKLLTILVWIEQYISISLWEVLRKLLNGYITHHSQQYESKMRRVARKYSGVICGHIHLPCMSNGYMNTGDWVQHCSAIVETHAGEFELLKG